MVYPLGRILREDYEGWDLGRVWVGNVNEWCRLSGWVEAEDVKVGQGAKLLTAGWGGKQFGAGWGGKQCLAWSEICE